jgi:hypothetical protein
MRLLRYVITVILAIWFYWTAFQPRACWHFQELEYPPQSAQGSNNLPQRTRRWLSTSRERMSSYPGTRARNLVATTRPVRQPTVRELWNPDLDVEGVTSRAGRRAGRPCTRGSTVVKSASVLYTEELYETYLACADFVKSNKCKGLCKHSAGEILLRQ